MAQPINMKRVLPGLRALACVLALAALASCGKKAPAPGPNAPTVNTTPNPSSDPVATPSPPPTAEATATPATHSDKSGDVLKWLSMLSDKAKPDPPKPAANPAATSVASPASAPVVPASPLVASIPTPEATRVEASKTEAPRPAPVAPRPAPVVVQEPPTPAPVVATAAPTPTPAANIAHSEPKVLSREQPTLSREVLRTGIRQGHVQARLSINADGSVSKVEIIQSEPRGVFDKAVVAAGLRWKYAPMPAPETAIADFDFNLD